jgi:hypothetical protein
MHRLAPYIAGTVFLIALWPALAPAETDLAQVNPDESAGQLNAGEQKRIQEEQEKMQREVEEINAKRLREWKEENERMMEEWKREHPEAK